MCTTNLARVHIYTCVSCFLPAETSLKFHSIYSQSSFVCSSTQSFIRLLVRLILSPWFESKYEFACHRSRHRPQISQTINSLFLCIEVFDWLHFNSRYISTIDPLNDALRDSIWTKGVNITSPSNQILCKLNKVVLVRSSRDGTLFSKKNAKGHSQQLVKLKMDGSQNGDSLL